MVRSMNRSPLLPPGFLPGLLLGFCLLVRVENALATAGFAESSREFRYNGENIIELHHGDICSLEESPGKDCLVLAGMEGSGGGVYYPKALLDEINVPQKPAEKHVFGKRKADGSWFIYSLESRESMIETVDYGPALEVWRELGYRDPVFASAQNLPRYFRETSASRESGRRMLLALFVVPLLTMPLQRPLLGFPLAAGLLLYGYYAVRRHGKAAVFYLVPALLAAFCFLAILFITGLYLLFPKT